jgi:putative ABC transport system permease protein
MTRFRLRVIFQNIPNYVTIFVGIFFAEFIILFGLVFKPMLADFKDDIVNSMFAQYQYVLKAPVETADSKAEKAAMTSLETYKSPFKKEDVSIYGIEPDSRFVKLAAHGDKVTISTAYNHKFGYEVGDVITLKEQYTDKKYRFTVGGFFDYPSTIAIFMDREQFNKVFDNDAEYFNMYMSNSEIDDIDEKLIAATITQDDLTKTSRQLTRSMGDMMLIFVVFGVIIFVLIIMKVTLLSIMGYSIWIRI